LNNVFDTWVNAVSVAAEVAAAPGCRNATGNHGVQDALYSGNLWSRHEILEHNPAVFAVELSLLCRDAVGRPGHERGMKSAVECSRLKVLSDKGKPKRALGMD
jgi:hypothetical protein